jgi:hypothetical protein
MFRLRTLAIAGCILAATAGLVRAQDDELKAVLKKAIAAHGGEKNLTKFGGAISKFKGTIELNGKARDIAGEITLLKPDKMKNAMTLDYDGQQVPVVIVYNGKKMWKSIDNRTVEVKDEKELAQMRESLQADDPGSFRDYLKAPYELAAVGEVKIMDQPAIGIRVSKKGQRDVSYFFDKKTHLLVKTEMRAYDPDAGQEFTQEKFFVRYRDTDGLKSPARFVIHKDGKAFLDLEVTESKGYQKLDDSNFAMP